MSHVATNPQWSEAERLKALLEYDILDTPPDPALDEIVRVAAEVTGAPYAYLGFLDANRLWLKSRFGFQAADIPRLATADQYTILEPEPLLIADAAMEPRFPVRGLPLTRAIFCRSYLGAPLVGPDGSIGTLAVLSAKPNQFTEKHASFLGVLSRQIMMRLEYSIHSRSQDRSLRSRQRIERALTVERNFVSAVLDTMSALVLVVDTSGRIVRFNRACEETSGYTFAELAGRSFPQELFLPEEREKAFDLLQRATQEIRREPVEMHWLTRDARRRRIAWTTTTLTDGIGDINFIIMTGVDVTEQWEATTALHASEARYRQLIEGSLGIVFTHDLEGRILSINTNAAESLGYHPAEMVGTKMIEYVPEEQKPAFQNYLRSIATTGEEQGMISLRHRNGSIRSIAWRNRLIDLPDTALFVLGHGIDVTEKTDAENRLHALMRQRESILESVGDGIYGIDMQGRIVFVNQVGARMMGYTQEEMEGQDLLAVLGHARADGSPYKMEESPIYAARRAKAPIRARDEVFHHKDGHPIPVEYVACPMVSNGRVTGVVVAVQDVTERRRLDRMKDEFISTVSHELRTPLTALRAALGLIAGGALEKRPEKRSQMMEVAIGNTDRLVRLVNDILDFERMGAGRLPMRFQEVDAKDLLRRATDLQHPNAQKAGIGFLIDAGPLTLWVDEDRILQTLGNLINNAIKFSPRGSDIILRARAQSATEAIISVEDRGRGIPPEKLDIIFERFQQVDASDSRDMGGTGLGLAICRNIVRQHGGRIWVESTVGRGSTFYFTVPRTAARGDGGETMNPSQRSPRLL
ncbi:MAG TPA: PAS domain S-box protein [Acidobacteriaceae bacterium]|jgi:PAS domain S-box-containing protein|nr:PAS domain S-box protein [Acidobacteriaceae bacterium]